MTAEIVSVLCGGEGPTFRSVLRRDPKHHLIADMRTINNQSNEMTPCAAYHKLLEETDEQVDILIHLHDDLTLHDDYWAQRVMVLFENPNCVVVGLGGATSLGRPDLYRKPYRIENMARGGYCSNQTDAEVHGARFTGEKRVAVVDAFFMAVRREWLVSIGGWPVKHLTFHCLDLWLACEAARAGKETWVTGVSATHHGGGSSTKPAYRDAKWLQGGSRESDHQAPHLWLYREYSDVLPIEVPDVHSMDQRSRPPRVGTPARTEEAPRVEQVPDKVPDVRTRDQEPRRDGIAFPKAPKVNIVMTVRDRKRLTRQSLDTLYRNSAKADWNLTIVDDGSDIDVRLMVAVIAGEWDEWGCSDCDTVRVENSNHVLGLLKNLGVWYSERRFGRGEWLYLSDNDVYFTEGWLEKLIHAATISEQRGYLIWGGQAHPFHQPLITTCDIPPTMREHDCLAGTSWLMRWDTWDKYGPLDANAPGVCQSEDFAFTERLRKDGGRIGVIWPHVVYDTGITQTDGKPSPGAGQKRRVEGVIYE